MASKDLESSFMRSLCMGDIEEEILFPYPKMKDSERELCKTMNDSFKAWLEPKREEFRKWDREGHLPDEILKEIKEFGLFGFITPEEFGGMGLSTTAYSRAIQELSKYDASLTITAGAHNSIGMRGLVMFGNNEQKKKYLPKLATGELIAAYCLTESGAGSDAASIKTRAVKDGDHWVLNGEKLWITNGGMADFFTVFAQTDTPEGKITAFLVTRDMGGVTNGPHEDKMGLRASSTTTVHFENTRVPAANVLGEVGKGFKVAVKILNNGRTGLGGGSVGAMKLCISLATKQAKERKQFGQSISEFGMIKQKLGQMVVDCYAAESVVNMVSGIIDAGYKDYAVEAAISKVLASDLLFKTVDEALQIAAGNGYMREFPYERIMRDCRINRIFEGTNEILHLFIALTAISDVGKQLSDLTKAVKDPIKGFGLFVDYAKKHVVAQTGYGQEELTKHHPLLAEYSTKFSEHTRNLTAAVDRLLRKHGKNIVGKQFASKRLAAIMIDMFSYACVLSRVSSSLNEKGEAACKEELEIISAFSKQAGERMKTHYARIDDNEDETIKSLSDFVVGKEGYVWDNI